MPGLITAELFIIVTIALLVAAWIQILRRDDHPIVLVLAVIFAYFLPIIGPIAVLLIFRLPGKSKRKIFA